MPKLDFDICICLLCSKTYGWLQGDILAQNIKGADDLAENAFLNESIK